MLTLCLLHGLACGVPPCPGWGGWEGGGATNPSVAAVYPSIILCRGAKGCHARCRWTADVESRVRTAWIAWHAQKHVGLTAQRLGLWVMLSKPAVPLTKSFGGTAAPFAQA